MSSVSLSRNARVPASGSPRLRDGLATCRGARDASLLGWRHAVARRVAGGPRWVTRVVPSRCSSPPAPPGCGSASRSDPAGRGGPRSSRAARSGASADPASRRAHGPWGSADADRPPAPAGRSRAGCRAAARSPRTDWRPCSLRGPPGAALLQAILQRRDPPRHSPRGRRRTGLAHRHPLLDARPRKLTRGLLASELWRHGRLTEGARRRRGVGIDAGRHARAPPRSFEAVHHGGRALIRGAPGTDLTARLVAVGSQPTPWSTPLEPVMRRAVHRHPLAPCAFRARHARCGRVRRVGSHL